MSEPTSASASTSSGVFPGLTSLVHAGRGAMTIQTEARGEPAYLFSIVDFRGRVLKTYRSPFPICRDSRLSARARSWHAEVEAKVRATLERAKRRDLERDPVVSEVVANLYLAALRSYSELDFETAFELLRACEQLEPKDPRVRSALGRVSAIAA